jgi:septal ring factor EnvC (AmiA/AmiB activator)
MNFNDPWGLLLVEVSILVSLLVILFFVRRTLRMAPPKKARGLTQSRKSLETNLERINQLLKESETLTQDLTNNLTEKREIIKKLMESLDEKIRSLNLVVEKLEGKRPPPAPIVAGREGNGPVVEMALAGCGVPDIAKRLGLSQEEVRLILDLRKITTS